MKPFDGLAPADAVMAQIYRAIDQLAEVVGPEAASAAVFSHLEDSGVITFTGVAEDGTPVFTLDRFAGDTDV